jgi:hypothetical protein
LVKPHGLLRLFVAPIVGQPYLADPLVSGRSIVGHAARFQSCDMLPLPQTYAVRSRWKTVLQRPALWLLHSIAERSAKNDRKMIQK